MLSRYDYLNGSALKRLLQRGTELVPYENDVLKAAQVASVQLFSDISAKDPEFSALFQQWKNFQKEVSGWNTINEFSFSNFMYNS